MHLDHFKNLLTRIYALSCHCKDSKKTINSLQIIRSQLQIRAILRAVVGEYSKLILFV